MYWVELGVLFICFLAWKPLECVMSIFFAFHHDCECFKNTHTKSKKTNEIDPYLIIEKSWINNFGFHNHVSCQKVAIKNRIIGSILAKKGQGTWWDKKNGETGVKSCYLHEAAGVQEETEWCNTDWFVSRFWLLSLRLERFPPAATGVLDK